MWEMSWRKYQALWVDEVRFIKQCEMAQMVANKL